MAVATYTKTGSKASTAAKLPKELFEIEVTNHELIKSAYVAYLANGRSNLAKTKNRGDVSGGGKKPWRQKGTGRARFGSSRVPIWRKGGVAMGPTGNENYSHSITVGSKRVALKQALSVKNLAGAIAVVDDFEVTSGKTKDAVSLLAKLGATRNTLVAVTKTDEKVTKATRNLQDLKIVRVRALNVYDVMNADLLILTADSVAEISEWLGGKS